jgi:hypothetical protein
VGSAGGRDVAAAGVVDWADAGVDAFIAGLARLPR